MMRTKFVVDGVVKIALAIAGFVATSALEEAFQSPRWLVITAFVLLFLSSATQISYGVSKAEKRYFKFPMLFDGLLIVAAIIGIALAAAANPAGAWIFFGYIAAGSLGIAVVFTTGENGPQFSQQDSQNS
jgi:4-hydroxybenzoate polyprenyltransferase